MKIYYVHLHGCKKGTEGGLKNIECAVFVDEGASMEESVKEIIARRYEFVSGLCISKLQREGLLEVKEEPYQPWSHSPSNDPRTVQVSTEGTLAQADPHVERDPKA